MLKKLIYILLFIFFIIIGVKLNAETIDNITKEVKTFDDWTIVCNKDFMMEEVNCKIATKFYNNTATIYIQPENKIANQIVFIIPSVISGSKVKIKIAKNEVVESQGLSKEDFGVIPIKEEYKKLIFEQMKKSEDYLYIRFTIRNNIIPEGTKEITERISLAKFKEMLDYYYSQMTHGK